ncbi:MAG: hypothetical protein Q9196_004490 [Gyalolechia fulgens]
MQSCLEQTISAISTIDPADPITECPASVLALLPVAPDPLIALAHSKLHTFAFDSVPVCWRRLYTDASIAKAVGVIGKARGYSAGQASSQEEKPLGGGKATSDDEEAPKDKDWVDEVVRVLDMAAIMAGAAGREDTIERLLATLQNHLGEDGPPRRKRRKLGRERGSSFPVAENLELSKAPSISYPLQSSVAPSMQAFETHMETAQPILIDAALTHWPAMHERPWSSPEYLLEKTFGGRRLIPVEIGRSYTDVEWGQSIITFKEFMEKYLMSEAPDASRRGYLAQHDLFSQIPTLRNDIAVPDYCYTVPPHPKASGSAGTSKPPPAQLDEPLLNAWFGPAGTVSPLHTDPYHNILCQVVGKKYVRLYSPEQTEKLYPKGIEDGGVDMSNTSEVDAEAAAEVLNAEFPLFRQAKYVETILNEGECLYIPVGWWHYVRSLSVSFSVSFWWN